MKVHHISCQVSRWIFHIYWGFSIKVGCIKLIFTQLRYIRSWDFFGSYSLEVHISKIMMLHHLLKPISSEPLFSIFMKQSRNEIFGIITDIHVFREGNISFQYILEHFFLFLLIKRRLSYKHFISNNTQSPPINWERMALLSNYFWCHILRGTSHRVRVLPCWEIQLFRYSKVYQPQIP